MLIANKWLGYLSLHECLTPLSLSHTPLPLPPGAVSRVMDDNAREGLQDAWVGDGGQIHGAEHPTFFRPYEQVVSGYSYNWP